MSSGVESGQRLLHGGLRVIENQWVFSCECVSNASLGIFVLQGKPALPFWQCMGQVATFQLRLA